MIGVLRAFYRETYKPFFIFFLIGAALIWLVSPVDPLLWLCDVLVSFGLAFALIFRKHETRPEFKGDR